MEVKQHEVALKLTFKPCLKIGNLNYTTDKPVYDSNLKKIHTSKHFIASFNANLSNALSIYEAKQHIENYIQWYNFERKHRKLGRITPHQKWTTGKPASTTHCKNRFCPTYRGLVQ